MNKAVNSKNISGRRIAEGRSLLQPPLTQDALSGQMARVGIQLDRAAIAKIETNCRSVLDYEIKAFAEVLGVKIEWLLGDTL